MMKNYLCLALVLIGTNAYVTSADAADSCPTLFLTNATGSPRVVQGSTVNFFVNGIAPAITIYFDNNAPIHIVDWFTPPGEWFSSAPSLTGVPVGAHTLRNGLEACTVNFTVVPIPPNPTMTQGWTYWTTGEDVNTTITHLFGFQRNYFGAMNPATTDNEKPYEALYDMQECNITGCNVSGSLTIGGWSSDPGKAWLNSVSALGNTKTGATAWYTYSNGYATWSWSGERFGFGAGGTTPITLSHN
jgi:hypothetical protein